MRRLLPQTLPGWMLLIVIGGLLVSQLSILAITSLDRRASEEVAELYRLNERAFSLVKLLSSAQTEQERKDIVAALIDSKYDMAISNMPAVDNAIATDDSLAELEDIMTSRLARFGVVEARVRRDPGNSGTGFSQRPPLGDDMGDVERDLHMLSQRLANSEHLTASIRLNDGTWLNFVAPVTPSPGVANSFTLPLFGAVALGVAMMAVWSIRRLTAPYRLMERAVKRIGADLKSPPISEEGSREYRAAAHAVNTMQIRLREYVEDREQLTAALAHDLRTPLTRIRLRLENLRRSPMRSSLVSDVNEIEAIVRSVVDFSTMEVAEEEDEKVDVGSLVYAIADDRETVSFVGAPPRAFVCTAKPVALRRCITNLIDNAVNYGRKAEVSLAKRESMILLQITDHGPGIPAGQLDSVFRPFVRVEKSRNRGTGGMGLGLTIARNIARGLGGDIRLSNSENGGLVTELFLPAAATTSSVSLSGQAA